MSATTSLRFGRVTLIVIAFCVVAAVAACSNTASSNRPAQQTPTAGPAGGGAATTVDGQVARGTTVFAQRCAKCHGAGGEGSAGAPAVIGAGALPLNPPAGARMRKGQFNTAMELGMFIKNGMPPGGPATPPQDVAAVMAFMLWSSGVAPTQAISPATAGSMPVRP